MPHRVSALVPKKLVLLGLLTFLAGPAAAFSSGPDKPAEDEKPDKPVDKVKDAIKKRVPRWRVSLRNAFTGNKRNVLTFEAVKDKVGDLAKMCPELFGYDGYLHDLWDDFKRFDHNADAQLDHFEGEQKWAKVPAYKKEALKACLGGLSNQRRKLLELSVDASGMVTTASTCTVSFLDKSGGDARAFGSDSAKVFTRPDAQTLSNALNQCPSKDYYGEHPCNQDGCPEGGPKSCESHYNSGNEQWLEDGSGSIVYMEGRYASMEGFACGVKLTGECERVEIGDADGDDGNNLDSDGCVALRIGGVFNRRRAAHYSSRRRTSIDSGDENANQNIIIKGGTADQFGSKVDMKMCYGPEGNPLQCQDAKGSSYNMYHPFIFDGVDGIDEDVCQDVCGIKVQLPPPPPPPPAVGSCAPPAQHFLFPAKTCGPGTCFNLNKPYDTFEAAWAACGTMSGCWGISYGAEYYQYGVKRYYLRQASDPNVANSPNGAMMYMCGPLAVIGEKGSADCPAGYTLVPSRFACAEIYQAMYWYGAHDASGREVLPPGNEERTVEGSLDEDWSHVIEGDNGAGPCPFDSDGKMSDSCTFWASPSPNFGSRRPAGCFLDINPTTNKKTLHFNPGDGMNHGGPHPDDYPVCMQPLTISFDPNNEPPSPPDGDDTGFTEPCIVTLYKEDDDPTDEDIIGMRQFGPGQWSTIFFSESDLENEAKAINISSGCAYVVVGDADGDCATVGSNTRNSNRECNGCSAFDFHLGTVLNPKAKAYVDAGDDELKATYKALEEIAMSKDHEGETFGPDTADNILLMGGGFYSLNDLGGNDLKGDLCGLYVVAKQSGINYDACWDPDAFPPFCCGSYEEHGTYSTDPVTGDEVFTVSADFEPGEKMCRGLVWKPWKIAYVIIIAILLIVATVVTIGGADIILGAAVVADAAAVTSEAAAVGLVAGEVTTGAVLVTGADLTAYAAAVGYTANVGAAAGGVMSTAGVSTTFMIGAGSIGAALPAATATMALATTITYAGIALGIAGASMALGAGAMVAVDTNPGWTYTPGTQYAGAETWDPPPPPPPPHCKVSLWYEDDGDVDGGTFEQTTYGLKNGDSTYENNIEKFKAESIPPGSNKCQKIVIYDEDDGCKANGDEETWYGDFGWRSLEGASRRRRRLDDVYHDSSCYSVFVN